MRPLFPGPMGLQEFIWGQRLVHVDAVEAVCGHTAIVTVTSEPLQTLWAPPQSPEKQDSSAPVASQESPSGVHEHRASSSGTEGELDVDHDGI